MGGEGSNSAPPSDTPPGGGTFPVNSSGQAYNPAWGSSTIQNIGKAISGLEFGGGGSPIPGVSSPDMPQGGIEVASIMDVLRRMGIGTQGYGTGGFDLSSIIPRG